jgi:transposase
MGSSRGTRTLLARGVWNARACRTGSLLIVCDLGWARVLAAARPTEVRRPAEFELRGPPGAARLLADVGDIRRFADRGRFASWNGTAPLDASSGDQQRHRLSRAGNRRINRTLHIMAVVQLRNQTKGRAYFDAKKAAGKTSMEAMRALKRRLSNLAYARMLADHKRRQAADPGGHSGTTLQSSVTDLTPDIGSSDKPLPGPATRQPKPGLPAMS